MGTIYFILGTITAILLIIACFTIVICRGVMEINRFLIDSKKDVNEQLSNRTDPEVTIEKSKDEELKNSNYEYILKLELEEMGFKIIREFTSTLKDEVSAGYSYKTPRVFKFSDSPIAGNIKLLSLDSEDWPDQVWNVIEFRKDGATFWTWDFTKELALLRLHQFAISYDLESRVANTDRSKSFNRFTV